MTTTVRALTGIDWGNGHYALTMLMYDWRSNTEVTKLVTDNSNAKSTLSLFGAPNNFVLTQNENEYGSIGVISVSDKAGVKSELLIPDSIKRNEQFMEGTILIPVTKENIFKIPSKDETIKIQALVFSIIFTLLDEQHPYTYNVTVSIKDSQSVLGKTASIPFRINVESLISDATANKINDTQVYLVEGDRISGPTAITIKH